MQTFKSRIRLVLILELIEKALCWVSGQAKVTSKRMRWSKAKSLNQLLAFDLSLILLYPKNTFFNNQVTWELELMKGYCYCHLPPSFYAFLLRISLTHQVRVSLSLSPLTTLAKARFFALSTVFLHDLIIHTQINILLKVQVNKNIYFLHKFYVCFVLHVKTDKVITLRQNQTHESLLNLLNPLNLLVYGNICSGKKFVQK